jgi:hypothetical protein
MTIMITMFYLTLKIKIVIKLSVSIHSAGSLEGQLNIYIYTVKHV